MKFFQIALALSAALLAAACLPVTTKAPVGSTVATVADPALFGMWRGQDKDRDEPGYFSFLKSEDGAMTALVVSLPKGQDDGEWEVFHLDTTTLGANHYMNVHETFEKGKPADDEMAKENIPLLYRVQGRTLTLYLIDEDAAKAAITSGKLKGTIGEGSNGDVQITSDAAELDAYLATPAGAALFKSKLFGLKKID